MGRHYGNTGRRNGQVLLMMTLVMVPMFGVLGLVTDVGYLHFVKVSAQTAAEVAAQAAIISFHSSVGGSNYTCGGGVVCSSTPTACATDITTPANAIEAGCLYAQQHGFKSAGSQSVTYQTGVSSAPPTVSGIGTASYWVTYEVQQTVPQLFSAVLGNRSGVVAARSTAAVVGASDCIYALNPTASGAVSVGGTASLTSSCGVYVDSSNSSALGTNGGGTISAPEYDVVGGVSTHYTLTPSPNLGVNPAADPLSNLPVPASAPYICDYKNYSAPNWSNPTLSPGVYCGGINVKNNNYTLQAGTYILVGGGLSTQSTNSQISGDGVTFYNTYGSTNQGTFSYSPISIDANSTVSLKAPNSGTYAGILFFEDRSAPARSDTYGGGSTAVYQGVIYAKNAAVTLYGNSSVNAKYTLLVADTISLVGTTGFNDDYSLLPNGSPIQKVVLVE
ncbi:MAG TPA: pilus assembly protein TadG-related protein [Bryobacteraceae bacterium]|nr:pilus assembly protein TadG-related protein [Bryobacteraceae bacterium]